MKRDTAEAEVGARSEERGLPVLTYHSLDDSGSVVSVRAVDFAVQMSSLADSGVRAISLAEAVAHRREHECWPVRSVVLTFDDGYANVHEPLLATLPRYGFTATVFVVSGHVGRSNEWAPPPRGLGTRAIMSWEHLSELSSAGFEIGAHTHTHRDPRTVSEPEIERDIIDSRHEIERHLGVAVSSFAYPFGIVTSGGLRTARREFSAACTTKLRRAFDDPLHELPRVDMYYIRTARTLQRLVAGDLDHHLCMRRWGRSLRAALAAARPVLPAARA